MSRMDGVVAPDVSWTVVALDVVRQRSGFTTGPMRRSNPILMDEVEDHTTDCAVCICHTS